MKAVAVAIVVAFWSVLGGSHVAMAKDRVGVFIVAADDIDEGIADNLSEVGLARVAETLHGELVGIGELRRHLAGSNPGQPPRQCLGEPACLALIKQTLGLSTILDGEVKRDGNRFRLTLRLDGADAKRHAFSQTVDENLEALIRAVQEGVAALFAPPSVPPKLVAQPPLGPPPPSLVEAKTTAPPGNRHAWPSAVAYSSAVASLLCLSTAAVFGSLGNEEAQGTTRGEAQQDLQRRVGYAHTANAFLMVGGALAAASVVLFIRK